MHDVAISRIRQVMLSSIMGPAPMTSMTISQALELALRHHNAGEFQQAESLYRNILATDPAHAPSLQLLGVIAYQSGENRDAMELISRAIAIDPNVASFHTNLGNVLRDEQRFHDAA